MCHIAGTSICTSPARASVADPTIVQSRLVDGHVMQRLELRVRVSVHTPPSDRRPEQVPLALSKPPQYKGLPSPGKDLNGPYDNQRHGTTDPGVHPQVAQRKSVKSLSRFPDPGTHPQVV